jgi:hypothetical protein
MEETEKESALRNVGTHAATISIHPAPDHHGNNRHQRDIVDGTVPHNLITCIVSIIKYYSRSPRYIRCVLNPALPKHLPYRGPARPVQHVACRKTAVSALLLGVDHFQRQITRNWVREGGSSPRPHRPRSQIRDRRSLPYAQR